MKNERKFELMEDGVWQNDVRLRGGWYGNIRKLGKKHLLELVDNDAREFNSQHDHNKVCVVT